MPNYSKQNALDLLKTSSINQLCAWCGVSRRTATHWVNGTRTPGPASLRLIFLHRSGRVLPPSRGWEGVSFDNGRLHLDNGQSYNPAELASFSVYAAAFYHQHSLISD